MARKSLTSNPTTPVATSHIPGIVLTLAEGGQGERTVKISLREMIAYSEGPGFTRLNLTRGKALDVKETTDKIDQLVRAAATGAIGTARN